MSPDTYQRISQDDTDTPVKVTHSTASLTYYNDNTYDDPSDQDSLLEKDGPPSPGFAERGDVGGRRSRTSSPTKEVRDW